MTIDITPIRRKLIQCGQRNRDDRAIEARFFTIVEGIQEFADEFAVPFQRVALGRIIADQADGIAQRLAARRLEGRPS